MSVLHDPDVHRKTPIPYKPVNEAYKNLTIQAAKAVSAMAKALDVKDRG